MLNTDSGKDRPVVQRRLFRSDRLKLYVDRFGKVSFSNDIFSVTKAIPNASSVGRSLPDVLRLGVDRLGRFDPVESIPHRFQRPAGMRRLYTISS